MQSIIGRYIITIVFFTGNFFLVQEGRVETIEEALSMAYLSNPQVLARKAQNQAIQESVTQALSGWYPSVVLNLSGGRGRYENNHALPIEQIRTERSGNITITQSLYQGGRTLASANQAKAKTQADSALLVNIEQTVLQEAAQAYIAVVRDKTVLDLNINNEQVLKRQLEAARDRFRVGELTHTDVAQAEARLARATAMRLSANGILQSSCATYEQIIGVKPGTLLFPVHFDPLPQSLPEAIHIALKDNPTILAAEQIVQAAQYGVKLVQGELRPTITLSSTIGRNWAQHLRDSRNEILEIKMTASMPLYQQGIPYSRLREAKYIVNQRQLEVEQTRHHTVETVTKAWANLQSVRAQIESFQTQISSAVIALEGVKYESKVGSRTVLDILNAEQELVDARIALIRAKGDELIAEYQLLASIGQMTAKGLKLTV